MVLGKGRSISLGRWSKLFQTGFNTGSVAWGLGLGGEVVLPVEITGEGEGIFDQGSVVEFWCATKG